MKSLSEHLLEEEHVSWNSIALLDLSKFLSNYLYQHFHHKLTLEISSYRNNLIVKFDELISDIIQVINHQSISFNYEQLKEKQNIIYKLINSDISHISELASDIIKSIQNTYSFDQVPRLSILYDDSTLDFYFQHNSEYLNSLISVCHDFLNFLKTENFKNSYKICNFLVSQFVKFDVNDWFKLNHEIINITPDNINLIFKYIQDFIPFFIPLNSKIFNQITFSNHLYSNKSISLSGVNKFNILFGEHQKSLKFLLSSFTTDFCIYLKLDSSEYCEIILIENLSNDSVNIVLDKEKSEDLIQYLKSNKVSCGEKIEISFKLSDIISDLPCICLYSCEMIATLI
jgi:hypothetical protein